MIRLLGREIATWRQRPEIVAASLAVIAIGAALWVSGYWSSQAAAASLSNLDPNRAQTELGFLAPYRFPASIAWIVASGVWLFFGIYYVGAATTGGDFTWATIRTALLAGRGRMAFVAARLLFVSVLGLTLVAIEVVAGIALPIVLSTGAGRPVSLNGVLLAIGSGCLGVVMYGWAAVCAALVLHDRATPLIAGAAAVVGQSVLSGLPIWSGGELLAWVPRLFPSNALGALLAQSEVSVGILSEAGVPPYLQIPWPLAGLIVTVWIAAIAAIAVVALYRADITA